MAKAVAVYHASSVTGKTALQFALGRDGNTYVREFKRHSRFGTKWNEWRLTNFENIVSMGFEDFKRIDKEIKVVLP